MDGPTLGLLPIAGTTQCHVALPALLRMLSMVAIRREELERDIDTEIARNPLLERAPGGPCVVCGRHTRHTVCPTCRSTRASGGLRIEQSAAYSPMEVLVGEVRAEVSASLRALVLPVLGSLDDRGLMTRTAAQLGADLGCQSSDVQSVLAAVRSAGPPGIASRTATECLIEQARWLVDHRQAPALLARLVADHLEDVADDHPERIATATGEPLATVHEAVAILRSRLRPWVTWAVDGAVEHRTPPPDVFVTTDGTAASGLRIDITDARWFGVRAVRLSSGCRTGAARSWVEPWERQARTFLQQLDTRAGALRAVATAVVEVQHAYLCRRQDAPCSLTRTTIASTCALSLSTVSRVVQGKHLRAPDGGVISLAGLFDPSASARSTVGRILERSPGLTDAEVSRRLAADGVVVARRTVAKYRAQLGIAATRCVAGGEATFV